MEYDVIVVGSGAAGIPLAVRLSEDPTISVLLLEEGQDFTNLEATPTELSTGYGPFLGTGTDFLKPYQAQYTHDQQGERLTARGRVVGGGTAVNSVTFLRGVPEDFHHWATLGNDQWSYQSVLPYFRRLERDVDFGGDDFHGSQGPVSVRRVWPADMLPHSRAFHQACIQQGYPACEDANGPDFMGVVPLPVNVEGGIRVSTRLAYLDPVRHRLHLTVRPQVLVKRVLFDKGVAIGVEAESAGALFQVRGRRIVLSAGALESPSILLRSGVGPAQELESLGIPLVQHLPGVGENLQSHPTLSVQFHNKRNLPWENLPNQVHFRYTATGSPTPRDMTITMEARPGSVQGRSAIHMLVVLEYEDSKGKLSLTSRDPNVPPSLEFRIMEQQRDLERMREGIRRAVSLADSPALQKYLGDRLAPTGQELASDGALEYWIKRNMSCQYHSCGTCKMGPASDPMAVVDQRGSVHGVKGLSVVDGSVMPHVVRGNLNATCVMIGERMSDMVKELI